MQPYPIQDTDSFESLLGTVKAGFPSPADDFLIWGIVTWVIKKA